MRIAVTVLMWEDVSQLKHICFVGSFSQIINKLFVLAISCSLFLKTNTYSVEKVLAQV